MESVMVNLVFFTAVIHLTFFVKTVFLLDDEKTPIWDNPSDEGVKTSTEFERFKFSMQIANHIGVTFTKEKFLEAIIKNFNPNAICSHDLTCGVQVYDEATHAPNLPFIQYCTCSEGFQCIRDGDNVLQPFFYSRCKKELNVNIPNSGATSDAPVSDLPFKLDPLRDTTPEKQAGTVLDTKNPNTKWDISYSAFIKQPSMEGDYHSAKEPSCDCHCPTEKLCIPLSVFVFIPIKEDVPKMQINRPGLFALLFFIFLFIAAFSVFAILICISKKKVINPERSSPAPKAIIPLLSRLATTAFIPVRSSPAPKAIIPLLSRLAATAFIPVRSTPSETDVIPMRSSPAPTAINPVQSNSAKIHTSEKTISKDSVIIQLCHSL